MRSIYLALSTALLMLFVYGCSSSSKSTPPGDDHNKELKKIDSLITTQSDYSDTLNVLFTHLDSTVAKDSLVKILLADPNVQMAQSTSQGVTVQYTNGMRGGILLDPKDGEETVGQSEQYKLGSFLGGDPSIGHKPSSKKTIFLNPSYWQRQHWADPLVAQANASFAKTGYDAFETYVNAQCTIDKFTSLSGYGIVHIYTHGLAFPDDKNIQEIYMLTGETASQATTDKYFADVKAGKVPIVVYDGSNKYCISPSFFARHNNFSDDTTLVYGGFCYSGLGGWKDTLIQVAKAGGYVGFDWHVQTRWNAAWARHMYTHMSDTSLARPVTLAEWRSADPDTDNTYWDDEPECQKWVSVWNYGYADLVLWRSLKILGIDPSAAPVGETVRVRGVGFGATKGTSTITFNSVLASPTSWSDTLIVTQVPESTTNGNVVVTVGTEHSNGFMFRLAEVTIVANVDTVWMLPNDTTYFSARVTGSSDTTVVWRVVQQVPYAPGWFLTVGANNCAFKASNAFVGIGQVVAKAHADTTKTDTIAIMVSVMDRLRQTPYIYCRFDGKMNYSINCSQTSYDLSTAFVMQNSQQYGMPVLHWEGNSFSIDGDTSFYSNPWIYREQFQVSGTMSAMGDTLLNVSIYLRESGNDPYFREWYHRVEATNIPLNSFMLYSGYNILRYQIYDPSLQNHITKLEDYYHETDDHGACFYERSATSVDWNSTTVNPRLNIEFNIIQTKVREFDNDSTVARERGTKQIAK